MRTRAPQPHRKRKFNDLSGNTYGHLTVVRRIDDKVSASGKIQVNYKCLCDCGNEYDTSATRLRRSDENASCGCRKSELRSKKMQGRNLQDLAGQRFHRWLVIDRAESRVMPSGRKTTMWNCRCDCSFEKAIAAGSLKGGGTKSCGCLKKDVLSLDRDLVGAVFGRWVVLHQGEPDKRWGRSNKVWVCRCECGETKNVLENSLVQGKTVSCGCYRVEQLRELATYDDLSGREFNRWRVVSRTDDKFYPGGGRSQMWICRCECGSEGVVAGIMLRQGISQSCGCLFGSVMESHVRDYLDAHGFRYESQKVFSGLIGVGGGPLSYDFLVYRDEKPWLLIECQGEQHFRPVDYFGGEERFKVQQEHDARKRHFAESEDLKFLEIPYTVRTAEAIGDLLSNSLFHYKVIE